MLDSCNCYKNEGFAHNPRSEIIISASADYMRTHVCNLLNTCMQLTHCNHDNKNRIHTSRW